MGKNKGKSPEGQIQKDLEAKVQEDIGTEPKVFEDTQAEELDRLRGKAAELETGELPDLSEDTAGEFDEMREAQEGQLDMRRKEEQENLLLRLYGKGATQSTQAGEAAGRMLYGQEQTHLQIMSDDAARRLTARAGMADRMMNSLAFQAQVAQGQQQTALQAFGMEVQQIESGKDRAANMLDSLYGRRSNEKIANIGASAQRYSADKGLEGTKYSADAQVQSAGIHAAASRYGSDAQVRAAGIGAAAQRYSTDKSFKLQKMGLRQDMKQFNADLGFKESTLQYQDKWQGQDYELGKSQLAQQGKQADAALSAQKQQMWLSFAGGLLSDINLKQNVAVIDNPIDKVRALRGVTWDWLGSEAATTAGVIAQDVQSVMPSAVEETAEGYLAVNYAAVVGLLVQAVNELIERAE